jgi:hypothetical protein
MRNLLFALLLACGTSSSEPSCPVAAEAVHGATCKLGVDTTCKSQVGDYDCHCLCDGYWECDLIVRLCDAGVDIGEHD